jgi:hypothetical protein
MRKYAFDPSVALLEEIEDQDLSVTGGTSTTTIIIATVAVCSDALGNHGRICTATVECQNNCH